MGCTYFRKHKKKPCCNMGVGGQYHALVVLPLGMNQYPLYRRLGEPPSCS